MISYKPLWVLLARHGNKKTDLREIVGISTGTLAKLGKDQPVNLTVIDKICEHFNCPVSEVIEFVPRDD